MIGITDTKNTIKMATWNDEKKLEPMERLA